MANSAEARICSIQAGRVGRLGPHHVRSAFVKSPVAGVVTIGVTGVAGDEQADLSVHGDAAKAVYAYPVANYEAWQISHPQHEWPYGAVAENLTIAGWCEDNVCIGDIVQVGSVTLQVTQPREPCFKFALCFNDPALPAAIVRNGRCGWYYRVLQAGEVRAGDAMTLTERLNSTWPVSRMHRFIHRQQRSPEDARELAMLPGLAETWPARLQPYAAQSSAGAGGAS